MEFYDVLLKRHSVRSFLNTPIEEEALTRIIDAGRIAPSWCNRQCWRFVVIKNEQKKKMLGDTIANPNKECYSQAPVVIAICSEPSDSGVMEGKEYYLTDCGIAGEHMALAAVNEGLGSCWVGAFQEYAIRNILGIPKDIKIIALLLLGYPSEEAKQTKRRARQDTVYYDKWVQ